MMGNHFWATYLLALQSFPLITRSEQLTMSQQRTLLIVERSASMLSILASSFVLVSFVLSSRLRLRPFNRLLFLATWGNMFSNVATFIGNDGIHAGSKSAVCKVQGMLIQWFMPADCLWTFCMAVNVFLTFRTNKIHMSFSRLEKWYFLICYGTPAVPAITYLVLDFIGDSNYYGNATLWCWIAEDHDILRIITFYAPVWVMIVITMSLYAITGWAIYKGQARNSTADDVLSRRNSNCSTINYHGEGLPTINDTVVQVRKCTEIKQTSEMVMNQLAPVMALNWNAVPPGEEQQRSSFQQRNDTEQIKSTSVISSGITTIVTSRSTAADLDAAPSTPKHIPIVVPAFGDGTSKPLSIPLEHIPPHSQFSSANRVFSSSFSTTSTNHGRRRRTSCHSNAITYARVAFALYIIMLIVWVPSTVNRVYQLVTADSGSDRTNVPLNFAAACVLPLQGLFNSVIYGFVGRRDIVAGLNSFWIKLLRIIKGKKKDTFENLGHDVHQLHEELDTSQQDDVDEIAPVVNEDDNQLQGWPLKAKTASMQTLDEFKILSPTMGIGALT